MAFLAWIRELFQALRAQKVRTLSTLLGITWGTLSIVLMLAFGKGLEANMKQEAANFGRSIGIVWPQQTTRPWQGLGRGRQVQLLEKDVRDLERQIPELWAVSPEYRNREVLQVGPRQLRVELSGVYPQHGPLRNMVPEPGGRFLDDRDLAERRRVVFLGDRIKTALFGAAPAVGRRLVLRGMPFTVIGVLQPREQSSNYGALDADRVCLPATTHRQLFARHGLSNFVYRSRSPAVHAHATRRVYEVLGRRQRFDPSDTKALYLWDTTEQERMVDAIFLAFNLLLAGSGVLTLLVGGVGIANLMYIMVKQRTREIGILLAVGARPRRILRDVMAQAFVLVTLGGASGFLVSWAVTEVIARSPLTGDIGTPRISLVVAAPAVGFLLLTGFLAGWFPARRAAGLDPVRALQD